MNNPKFALKTALFFMLILCQIRIYRHNKTRKTPVLSVLCHKTVYKTGYLLIIKGITTHFCPCLTCLMKMHPYRRSINSIFSQQELINFPSYVAHFRKTVKTPPFLYISIKINIYNIRSYVNRLMSYRRKTALRHVRHLSYLSYKSLNCL